MSGLAAVRTSGESPTPPDSGSAWTTTTVAALIAAVSLVAAASLNRYSDTPSACHLYQVKVVARAANYISADSVGGECVIGDWLPNGAIAAYSYGGYHGNFNDGPGDWCYSFAGDTVGWKYMKVDGNGVCTLKSAPSAGDTLLYFGVVTNPDRAYETQIRPRI